MQVAPELAHGALGGQQFGHQLHGGVEYRLPLAIAGEQQRQRLQALLREGEDQQPLQVGGVADSGRIEIEFPYQRVAFLGQFFDARLADLAVLLTEQEQDPCQRLQFRALGQGIVQAFGQGLVVLPDTALLRLRQLPPSQGSQAAVEGMEAQLLDGIADIAIAIQLRFDQVGGGFLPRQQGVVRRHRAAVAAYQRRAARQPGERRVQAAPGDLLGAEGVELARHLGERLVDRPAHPGAHVPVIEGAVEPRGAVDQGEFAFVVAAILVLGMNIGNPPGLEMHLIGGLVRTSLGQVVDHQLVQARCQQADGFDGIDGAEQFAVFAARHRAGHEDAQVADAGMLQVDDGAPGAAQRQVAGVDVGDPVQRLLRRGDVVAIGAEDHHRCLDPFQVDPVALAAKAAGQVVADEQVVDDQLDLLAVEQSWAAPPALEIEKARGFAVDLAEQVVVLAPVGVGRVQAFEVADQPGAVEAAVAQVATQACHPGAAEQAAGIAHRIAPVDAGPVGQRRAVDDHQARQFRARRRQPHQCPAGLAVADHHRLVGLGVAPAYFFDIAALGIGDVDQRLPGLG